MLRQADPSTGAGPVDDAMPAAHPMSIFDNPEFDDHEVVHAFCDPAAGLKGFIAIHSTVLGPAFGGCRMWNYPGEGEAVRDALRLSQGMSYKNALAGLAYGGGKAVIIADPRRDKTPDLLTAFGRVVESFGGRYITAEDVGTGIDDMLVVAGVTRHVSGIAREGGFAGGDPSPKTALGLFHAMRAAVRFALGREDFAGLTVAVQGLGNVGYKLCQLLHDAGARLTVADVVEANVARAAADLGATAVAADRILAAEADVLSPCALGGVLNAGSIPHIRAPIVCGSANNQLATPEDGERLRQRGILYAPDYVVNAGGIISAVAEYEGNVPELVVDERIAAIHDRTLQILERARAEDSATSAVADQMAREIIARARQA